MVKPVRKRVRKPVRNPSATRPQRAIVVNFLANICVRPFWEYPSARVRSKTRPQTRPQPVLRSNSMFLALFAGLFADGLNGFSKNPSPARPQTSRRNIYRGLSEKRVRAVRTSILNPILCQIGGVL